MTSTSVRKGLLVAAGLLVTTAAHADETYMWGVGGHISTFVVPGKYPITFPDQVDKYNFIDEEEEFGGDPDSDEPKRDLDADGDPLFHTLERVKTDVHVGGDFVYYLDGENRIGLSGEVGSGTRYFDMNVMGRYDHVYTSIDEFELLIGGGIGVGAMTFKGTTSPEKLAVSYFPLRAQAAGLYRAKTAAFQLALYGQSNVPSNQTYTKADGTEVDSVGTAFSVFSYLSLGLEFTAMFGDFKPPVNKKKKGKKGGKGGGNKK